MERLYFTSLQSILAQGSEILYLWKHARQNLQAQVFLVSQSVGTPLQNPNLVVQSFHKAQRHFILRLAIGSDAVPVANDHQGEVLVGSQTLPLQGCSPVLHESSGPAFLLIVPQLAERFLQQIGRVQPFVGFKQFLQRTPTVERQVFSVRQQRILLTLDEVAAPSGKPGIFTLAHLVQSVAQMTHHVEFVEQNPCLWGVSRLDRRVLKRLPHVHYGQLNPFALLWSQPLVKLIHTFFGPVLTSKPYRAQTDKVTDDNPVTMSLSDRNLVNPDDPRPRGSDPAQLLVHVLLVELFDRLPVQMQFFGNVLDRRSPATATDEESKAIGVKRIVGQPRKPFAFHLATVPAQDASDLDLQVDACVAARQIPYPAQPVVVERPVPLAANAADSFFPRRESRMMRALGSPKMPRTVVLGEKPGKRYVSWSLRYKRIRRSCHVSSRIRNHKTQGQQGLHDENSGFLPTHFGEEAI